MITNRGIDHTKMKTTTEVAVVIEDVNIKEELMRTGTKEGSMNNKKTEIMREMKTVIIVTKDRKEEEEAIGITITNETTATKGNKEVLIEEAETCNNARVVNTEDVEVIPVAVGTDRGRIVGNSNIIEVGINKGTKEDNNIEIMMTMLNIDAMITTTTRDNQKDQGLNSNNKEVVIDKKVTIITNTEETHKPELVEDSEEVKTDCI